MAQVSIQHVPYKGAAPAALDLIAGQMQPSFASTPGSVPQVRTGKPKALAAEFGAFIRAESEKRGKVVKLSGVRAD